MYKLLVLVAVTIALAGCATGPKVAPKTEQFCDMYTKTVVVKTSSGQYEEQTVEVMECNDNPIKRLFQVQSGMAPNCGEFTYWMRMGDRNVQRKGVSCQKPDGSWEIVNTSQW